MFAAEVRAQTETTIEDPEDDTAYNNTNQIQPCGQTLPNQTIAVGVSNTRVISLNPFEMMTTIDIRSVESDNDGFWYFPEAFELSSGLDNSATWLVQVELNGDTVAEHDGRVLPDM
jgi:hypothetical protein